MKQHELTRPTDQQKKNLREGGNAERKTLKEMSTVKGNCTESPNNKTVAVPMAK